MADTQKKDGEEKEKVLSFEFYWHGGQSQGGQAATEWTGEHCRNSEFRKVGRPNKTSAGSGAAAQRADSREEWTSH